MHQRHEPTPRQKFHVIVRDFTLASGTRTIKVWASSPEAAEEQGRISAYAFGDWPEVIDVKQRGGH